MTKSIPIKLPSVFPLNKEKEAEHLEAARVELERVPATTLVAAASSMCADRTMDQDIALGLRVFLLDDRLARFAAKLPGLLFDIWQSSARRSPQQWPPPILGKLVEWLSWHPEIGRRIGAAELAEHTIDFATKPIDCALRQLVEDAVPAVRAAAQTALTNIIAREPSLVASQLVASWAVASSAPQRLAIACALKGAIEIVGAATALERLVHDADPTIRKAAVEAAGAAETFAERTSAIVQSAVDDPAREVRREATRQLHDGSSPESE